MTENLRYTVVDGIKCFSPQVADSYADYPDGGFDVTDKNAANSFWVRSRNRLFKNLVHGQLQPERTTKLLEIGCGTGDFIGQLVKNNKLEITGSEIYLKGLRYAKQNLPDVEFIQFDVTQGTLGEDFDLILAFDVIEHIENDVVAISNINKMLRQGGSFIVSVPQHMFLWSQLDEIVKHKRRYSRRELVAKLQENGFDITYATSFLFVLFPLMLITRLFDRGHKQAQTEEAALEKRVKFSGALNWVLDRFMRIDEILIRWGVSLPCGGTLVVIAHKR